MCSHERRTRRRRRTLAALAPRGGGLRPSLTTPPCVAERWSSGRPGDPSRRHHRPGGTVRSSRSCRDLPVTTARWVERDGRRALPRARVACPPFRMTVAGALVDRLAGREDRDVLAVVPIRRGDVADTAVLVL